MATTSANVTALVPTYLLSISTQCIGVAKGGTSNAKHVTDLPFTALSPQTQQANSFDNFPQPLMSVGKVANDQSSQRME